MVPGRKFDVDHVLHLAWQWKWMLVVPMAVFGTVAALVAARLPDHYRSETLIQVIPQQILPEYATSTVLGSGESQQRLQAVTDIVTARPHLERIVEDLDLYAGDSGTKSARVSRLRKAIGVDVTTRTGSFRISFEAGDPDTAMKVTERLGRVVIEENLRDRQIVASDTSTFLESQLGDARRRLIEHEKRLEAYRLRYSGQLPTQLESNMQAAQSLQMQVQSLVESLNNDKLRRLTVERMIADLSVDPLAGAGAPGSAQTTSPDGIPTDGPATVRLAAAREALSSAQTRLTDLHPDVTRLKRLIEKLENEVAREATEPKPDHPVLVLSPVELQRQNRLRELRAERDNLDLQIAYKQDEEKKIRAAIAQYRARIDAAPRHESGLAELMRDYDTLQTTYKTLLAKREESKITENLEQRQVGDKFKILEPAERPARPAGPNRLLIDLAGAVFGLFAGLGVAALAVILDTKPRNERELSVAASLPVLASVPEMKTSSERRRSALKSVVGVVVGLGSVAVWLMTLVETLR